MPSARFEGKIANECKYTNRAGRWRTGVFNWHRPKKRTSLMVSEAVHNKVRLLAALEGKTVMEATEALLQDALRRRAQELRDAKWPILEGN